MAAQTTLMSTACLEIIARDLGLHPFDFKYYTVKAGVTDMVPGMIVTTYGETGSDIDIHQDGDEWITGIVIKRKTRKISADGAVSDTIDTAFAAGDEVEVLHRTGGRAHVYMWITGLTTGDGTVRAGAEVFMVDINSPALASTNITVGSGMCLIAGLDPYALTEAAPNTTTRTIPFVTIGLALEDTVVADDAGAEVGVIVKVAF